MKILISSWGFQGLLEEFKTQIRGFVPIGMMEQLPHVKTSSERLEKVSQRNESGDRSPV
jgi:hypothetical protein